MANKKEDNNEAPELIKTDAEIEERVKQMMEPEPKKPEAPETSGSSESPNADGPGTAPVIEGLPVPDPKKPLKIKILHDNDEPSLEPAETAEPALPTAPELPIEADEKTKQEAAETQTDNLDTSEEESSEPGAPEIQPTDEETTSDEPPTQTELEPGPKLETADDKPEKLEESTSQTEKLASKDENQQDDLPEDADTARAVDDIVRKEGDALLDADDNKILAATKAVEKKPSGHKLRHKIASIWKRIPKRKVFATVFVSALLVAGIVPQSRYYVLNSAGIRASASVFVLDESTLQPLRNVKVSVQGHETLTDENGEAKLEKLKLGPSQLKIERRAFAAVEKPVTIGWGSNPFGEHKLKPTGTQYSFMISDFLSGKGIVKAEASSDDASAFSDEQGKILLTMEDPKDEITVSITSEGRRTEKVTISADTKESTAVQMVPARKHAYISKRDGRYDVYASYADGKDETLILKASGSERDDMVLVAHPTEEVIALVSTRDAKRNKDGFLLSGLSIVDLRTKSIESVQTSERIQVIGWFGERLVYVRVISGSSASNPERNRLMAYHFRDDTDNELAASNYFNDVMAVGDLIYFAPSSIYANGVNVSLFSINPDGSDRKVIINKEVWNMFRTSYDHIALSVPGAWYDFRLGQESPDKLDGEPANLKSRVYTNSPNNEKSLWVDNRDGKGVLVVHDVATGEEKTLRDQNGLKNPVRWLDDRTIVYRVKTESETADYALSLDGGEPKKIADVTNTDGIDRWYYY